MTFLDDECTLCRRPLSHPWSGFLRHLCPVCFARTVEATDRTAESLCAVCSMPNPSRGETCEDCATRVWDFEEISGVFAYASSACEILRRYKFEPLPELASDLGEISLAHFWPRGPIVPVPTTRTRSRERGWNPVQRWAKSLARKARVPFWDVLEKTETVAQKTLSKSKRFDTATSSFRLKTAVPNAAKSVPFVWLLDDVVTTGASVQACSKILKDSGVKAIKVLTLGLH